MGRLGACIGSIGKEMWQMSFIKVETAYWLVSLEKKFSRMLVYLDFTLTHIRFWAIAVPKPLMP
jgi:hypothetical protein